MTTTPPPTPPEMDHVPKREPSRPPATFIPPGRDDDYVEIEIPASSKSSTQQEADSGCLRGCLYGLGGALGCVVLIAVVLVTSLFVAGKELTGFVGNMANYLEIDLGFVDWDDRAEVEIPANVFVPSVEPIQELAEVVTTRYNYSQIVTGQSDMPATLARLYGDELVLIAVGHIEAGIDVSQITEDDIVYDAEMRQLTVTLPAPRLRACFLNEAQSYVAERRTGVFAATDVDLEDTTRAYAVRQFRNAALEEGILEQTAGDVLNVMNSFLQSTLPEDVELDLRLDPIDPDASLPETCA